MTFRPPMTLLASHTHWNHIGEAHEFGSTEDERFVHPAEAPTLADPNPEHMLYAKYSTIIVMPTPSGGRLPDGTRAATASGHPALREERAGTPFAQDAGYDGPLEADIAPRIVQGGHVPSFGPVRFSQVIVPDPAKTESFQITA